MAQVKIYDKRVGTTYVYDSVSYYDPEKHQSRSRRKLIGKIDPQTGEMIPTGKTGRPRKNPLPAEEEEPDYKNIYKKAVRDAERYEAHIDELEIELHRVKTELQECRRTFSKICTLAGPYTEEK